MNIIKPTDNLDEVKKLHTANRKAWNEVAIKYSQGLDETIAFIKAGKSSIDRYVTHVGETVIIQVAYAIGDNKWHIP